MPDRYLIADLFCELLKDGLGLDVDHDVDLVDTPLRYADSLIEMLSGMVDTNDKANDILSATFPADGYDEMVTQAGIRATGMCPHHFLPIEYTITVGYVPSKDGQCVGLSKLARLSELLAARPIKQEKLTVDIVNYLVSALSPVGAGTIVSGVHGCMTCRGVKQRDSSTVTTCLYGSMKDDPKCRAEFLSYRVD